MPKYAAAGIIIDISEDLDATADVIDGRCVVTGENLDQLDSFLVQFPYSRDYPKLSEKSEKERAGHTSKHVNKIQDIKHTSIVTSPKPPAAILPFILPEGFRRALIAVEYS